jgi:hypothetical protein
MKIKAISLWQPWATLVAIGAKHYETRHWPTGYRGPLAIHAAKRWTPEQGDLCITEPFRTALRGFHLRLPLGELLAICDLAGCFTTNYPPPGISGDEIAFGDWSPGRFAWRLENVRCLTPPIPWKGSQGFFEVELPLSPSRPPEQTELKPAAGEL